MKITTNLSSKITFLILLFVIIFNYGCRDNVDNNINPSGITNFGDLKINSNFKFSTTKELGVHLEIMSNNPEEPTHKFGIYLGNPDQGGKLIISGITDPYHTFQTTIKIPSFVNELYITNQDVFNNIEIYLLRID